MNSPSVALPRLTVVAPLRIVMADPDEHLQHAYRATLAHQGVEVVGALSGVDCVARLRDHVPDVVVLDPLLPWGGGEGVLALMDETPALAIIPVMVLTSCRERNVLSGLARFAISDYHAKPLAPAQLVHRLRALYGHCRLRNTVAEQNRRLERLIAMRTGGRVKKLRVETGFGRVIVRGYCSSYHIRQLTLAAVLEAFQVFESRPRSIDVQIEVRWRIPAGRQQETSTDSPGEARSPPHHILGMTK